MKNFESTSLEDIYFDVESARRRYGDLKSCFKTNFNGHEPEFICRSPGRVNIIGDHIDYSYFPCLPAAISFDVVMAVKIIYSNEQDTVPGFVRLANTDHRFEVHEYRLENETQISGNSWANYFKCSYNTVRKYLDENDLKSQRQVAGLEVAVSGNIPAGGGLSSSAAFVVCAALVTLHCFGPSSLPLDKFALTKLSMTCEQLVGVNSGGMDQAASIFGEKDYALLVNFRPDLSVNPLQFPKVPDPLVFLISNSLVVSAKLETAPIHYNLRVVEVTIAANILANKMGNLMIPQDGNLHAGTLHGVLIAQYGDVSPRTLTSMISDVDKHLKVDGYSEKEVSQILNCSIEELRSKYMSKFPVRFETLKLHQRAKHVYEEALRVFLFVEAMSQGISSKILGHLMNDSQKSAENLYENSHPDCELLCKIALANGSLGSRITGAGWGGCVVHLVHRSKADRVRSALIKDYYSVKHPDAYEGALIETRPGGGSTMFLNLQI